MLKFIGSAGLLLAALAATVVFAGALSTESGSQAGGRFWGIALAGLALLAGLLLAYGCALGGGGFDGVPLARWWLVTMALLAACIVVVLAAALRTEPRQETPWALLPVRDWAHWVWLPGLLAGAALGLYPALRQALPPHGWQWPLAALGALSMLICLGMLAQVVMAQQAAQVRQVQGEIDDMQRRDAWVLDEVEKLDVQRDFVSLLPQTSPFETPRIRARALERLREHPDLDGALVAVLKGPHAEEAFAYLQANPVRDPAAMAEAIRVGIEAYAAELRQSVAATHTLRPDDFQPSVRRVLATVERYAPQGVPYGPALRQLRDAFDAPRDFAQPTPRMAAQQDIDAWLRRH